MKNKFRITENTDTNFCIQEKRTSRYAVVGYVRDDTFFLEALYIPFYLRRKGYGSKLIKCCKKYMKQHHIKKMVANANPLGIDDKDLARFYETNKFNVTNYPDIFYERSS